jgi:hypothetical protein
MGRALMAIGCFDQISLIDKKNKEKIMALKIEKMNKKSPVVTKIDTQDLDSICGGIQPYRAGSVSVRHCGLGTFQDINMRRLRRLINPLDPISSPRF